MGPVPHPGPRGRSGRGEGLRPRPSVLRETRASPRCRRGTTCWAAFRCSGAAERGIAAEFASVSFTALESLAGARPDPEASGLYRVEAGAAVTSCYCPEAWLARWLADTQGHRQPVWGLSKAGVRPLREALRFLTRRLEIDLVVLVDGGIDLILRGDETSIGTPSEDLATLCATAGLDASPSPCASLRHRAPRGHTTSRYSTHRGLQRLGAFLGAMTLDPRRRPKSYLRP